MEIENYAKPLLNRFETVLSPACQSIRTSISNAVKGVKDRHWKGIRFDNTETAFPTTSADIPPKMTICLTSSSTQQLRQLIQAIQAAQPNSVFNAMKDIDKRYLYDHSGIARAGIENRNITVGEIWRELHYLYLYNLALISGSV
jgi:hypothetical protein